MAAIRFPLKMADGAQVKTIEELRGHFDLADVVRYYNDGRLYKWLKAWYYDAEAEQVRRLDSCSKDLKKSLCEILGVTYQESRFGSVDLDDISKKKERLERLKQFTADDRILSSVDSVSFTQEELMGLLGRCERTIYLCGKRFVIPGDIGYVTYVGVNNCTVEFGGNAVEEGIILKALKLDIEKYLDKYFDFNKEYDCLENYIKLFGNKELGIDLLKEEANKNSAQSSFILGVFYVKGGNYKEAVKWYRKGAERGNPYAQNNLGVCYEEGRGVELNNSEAVKWYSKAVDQDCVDAFYNLGCCYYNGDGVENDDSKAVRLFRKAAEKGMALAQNALGDCYSDGRGVDEDYFEAVKWYRKAAEHGISNSQYMLGFCYSKGLGVELDSQEGMRWIYKAAEQGNAIAQNNLGNLYYWGDDSIKPDKCEAVRWYHKAADQGYADAQYNLGNCYFAGHGCWVNRQAAATWFRKAAEQGLAEAQVSLGRLYLAGEGVQSDHSEAVKWLSNAAEQGDADAQNLLGNCYYSGNGVHKNYYEAEKWFRLAAEQGHSDARNNLNVLLKNPKFLWYNHKSI